MWKGTVGLSSNGELHQERPMLTYIRAKQILLVHTGSPHWLFEQFQGGMVHTIQKSPRRRA